MNLKTYRFTFGLGTPLGKYYVEFQVLDCENSSTLARDKMFAAFGREWAFQYDMREWSKNNNKEHLIKLELTESFK